MSSPGLGPAVHWTMLIHFTAVSTITYIFTKMMSMLKIIINLYQHSTQLAQVFHKLAAAGLFEGRHTIPSVG